MFIISKESIKLIANNKKLIMIILLMIKWEAGIELFGTEVKSIRMGKCSIKEAFVKIDKGKCMCMVCISAPMRREIFLIRIL